MKMPLLFTLMTGVLSLYGELSWGMNTVMVGAPALPAKHQALLNTKTTCDTLKAQAAKARAKAATACKNSGSKPEKLAKNGNIDFTSCMERADECAAADSTEQDGTEALSGAADSIFASIGMPGLNLSAGKYRGQCLSRKDWKDEKKDLNRDLKDSNDSIAKLQKDIIKTQEEAEKDKKRTNEALQDLNEKSRKEDLENKQNQRSEAERAQAETLRMQAEVRQTRVEILRDQGTLAKIIGERTRSLAKLSNALIQKNCMEALEKVKAGIKSLSLGSANAVITQNSENRKRMKLEYDSCLQEAQTIRESGRQEADAQIEAMQQAIVDKQAKISGIESSLSTRASHLAQAQAEQAQSQQQAQLERSQRQYNLMNELSTIDSAAKQKVMSLQQQLMKEQTHMNRHSNDLATLGKAPAGKAAPEDAIELVEEAKGYEKQLTSLGCDTIESKIQNLPDGGQR